MPNSSTELLRRRPSYRMRSDFSLLHSGRMRKQVYVETKEVLSVCNGKTALWTVIAWGSCVVSILQIFLR